MMCASRRTNAHKGVGSTMNEAEYAAQQEAAYALDRLAQRAAADAFAPMRDDNVLAMQLMTFVTGVSYNGGESRVTVWSVDEATIVVISTVDGEDGVSHRVFFPEEDL